MPLNSIDITIEWQGKQHQCRLDEVTGAGKETKSSWHLMVYRDGKDGIGWYYWGALQHSETIKENDGFRFSSNVLPDDCFVDQLVRFVLAWYE